MFKRTLGTVVLMLAASAAHAYDVRAFFAGSQLTESSGFQVVTVEATWGVNDDPADCTLNVSVSAGPFTQPIGTEATPGVDYLPVDTVVSLTVNGSNATTDTATFQVTVIDDDLVEADQEFTARITDVEFVGCIGTPIANIDSTEDFFPIVNDDVGALTLSLGQPAVLVEEDAGSVSIQATLSGVETIEGDFEVMASWQLVDGTATLLVDYGSDVAEGSFFFDRNTLTQTLVIPLLDDDEVEDIETFEFQLTGADGLLAADESSLTVATTIASTTVQIVDDDGSGAPVFANDLFQVNESTGNATITLLRLGGSGGPLTAFYQVVAGTATAGADFVAVTGSVTWADGDEADKTFDVPIVDDALTEANETVFVRISTDPDFASFQEAELTIIDDEGPTTASFAAAAMNVDAQAEQVVVTLVRGGSITGEVTVTYATEDGTAVAGEDYVAAAGTVTWADGDGADKTIVIELIADTDVEDAEDFTVNLTGITGVGTIGSNASITITIGADESRDIAEIPGLTPNQLALAQWFDTTCERIAEIDQPTAGQLDLLTVCAELRNVAADDAAVREALEAINPEELLVSTFNALRLTSLQHGNLSHRLNALRNGATGLNLVGLNLEVDGQQIAGHALQEMFDRLTGGGASADESPWGRWGAFVNGRIATGDQDESANEAGFDFDLYSVTAGVDYRFRPNLIVGISAGFGSVDTDFEGGEGGMDIDSWNGALYLTYFREDTFYLDALATYGKNDYESLRRIAFGNIQRTGRGETDGTQWSLGVGAGWDFSRGGVTFGPHFGAYYFDVAVDGFTETGALGLSVAVDDQNSQSFTVNGGGHISYAWLTDWGVLVPNARLDWVHEFEDNRETLSFRFVNDPFTGNGNEPSPTITLQSNRPDPNYLIWSIGVSAQFVHGLSGFVNYQAYTGYGDVSMSEWSIGARWEKAF